jgi:peptidoglycan/xylan/chitin deacetylase (PgdA/CDA1 family)/glycosyltransferase involved in cell wall biosynthesis
MLSSLFKVLSRGRLTIFMFHKVPSVDDGLLKDEVTVEQFERTARTLATLFRIVPLEDALRALRAGNLPPRTACITFDDGYADWLGGVVPVLEALQLHATFYVTTGQFQGTPIWFERMRHAVSMGSAQTPPLQLPGSPLAPLAMDTVARRRAALLQIDRALKYQPMDLREEWMQQIERHMGADRSQVPMMSAGDLRTIHSKGFGVGGHSVNHPILACCQSADAYREIADSREQLEDLIGGRVSAFAYPNGVPQKDFGSEHVAMVKRAGYTSAVTTHWGAASQDTSMFQVPRFTPWGPGLLKMQLQLIRNLVHRPDEVTEREEQGKRALMVAFHFPPQAGSSGILRTLNFVKYLPEHGWQPEVLTANAKAHAQQRNDLVDSIPAHTRIRRGFALDAARHLSLAGKYSRFTALPDRWSTWWAGGVWTGLRAIRTQKPDLIWSTYPISTAHLIAGTLSKWRGIPWVADFRDPMVSADYPSDGLQRNVWQRIEAMVFRQARYCVFTTQRAADAYGKRFPASAEKCVVIENGYDEAAFAGISVSSGARASGKLLMLHSGLIYPEDRNPSAMFVAVRNLIERGSLDRGGVCIRFRAAHHEDELMAFARQVGVEEIVEVAPPIPYRAAIEEMMSADVLLLFQGRNFNAQVPAKVYEYLRAQRHVLAAVDPAGDTAALLRDFANVAIADIDDEVALEKALMSCMGALDSLDALPGFEDNLRTVGTFSRAAQARRLAALFDKVA